MGFADSIRKSADSTKSKIDKKVTNTAFQLFTMIVNKTPVGDSETKGQLINNWQVATGKGVINRTVSTVFDTSGAASYGQILKLKSGREFYGKDGEVSLANSVHYAYRAEYFGWNFYADEPRWRGTKPYGMIRNSITAIKAGKGVP